MPIGRLDFNTEGLLLLTNDGGFKREMELPATGVPRTYRARTFGRVSQAQLEDLMDGIEIEGVRYGPIDANLERRTGHNQWVELTLTEGKNREVRRVLEHLGLEVSRLIRTAYGPFALGDLAQGAASRCARRSSSGSAARSRDPPRRGSDGALDAGGRTRGPARGKRPPPAADVPRREPAADSACAAAPSRPGGGPKSEDHRRRMAPPAAAGAAGRRHAADRRPHARDAVRDADQPLGSFDELRVADLFAGSARSGSRRCRAARRAACSPSTSRRDPRAARQHRQLARAAALRRARGSVMQLGPAKAPYDLILLDPPYGSGAGAVALDRLARLGWIGEAAGSRSRPRTTRRSGQGARDRSERKVGKAKLTLLRSGRPSVTRAA
jgi:23S rRNA pseudouridine2605 synthase